MKADASRDDCSIDLVQSDEEIARCFAVMSQLRPHLQRADFVERVRRQQHDGYQLAALQTGDGIGAVAGFRIVEMLAHGRFLYVDDLVSDENRRSRGYGQQLFQWLCDFAQTQDCAGIQLDSGVQRFDAHRFYFRQGMTISSYHFVLKWR